MNNSKKLCQVCGKNSTASPDGVCWECRKKNSEENRITPEVLQEALIRTEKTAAILRYRIEGLSFENISAIVELPMQTCYSMARRAVSHLKEKQ